VQQQHTAHNTQYNTKRRGKNNKIGDVRSEVVTDDKGWGRRWW
jgi:hypothetical protein